MTTAIEKVNGTPVTSAAEPRFDPLALAEAAAVRTRAEAEAEERRIQAEAEAEATRIKAAEEAEKQRIANERARMKLEREQADHAAKMAEATRKREEAERQTAEARAQEAAEQHAQAEHANTREKAATSWRKAALGFAVVCAIVALPVQMSAFWSPSAPWLLVAPLVLEGGAWVVLKGAAAAVEDRRPHWHYRAIAWALAFIASAVNLSHGLHAFDPATAIGTAFASLAGPGVWDLHEHGRIRTRDGKLTRAQRREKERARKRAAAEKAAAEEKAAQEKAAREEVARAAAEQLSTARAEHYPQVWEHAVKLAAALGETTVTETVWRRAHRDIEGADPGDSVDTIRTRNVAARRVEAARSETTGNTPIKVTSSQRGPQIPAARRAGPKTGPAVRGVRRKGDTAPYVNAARKQAAITAKNAARGDQS